MKAELGSFITINSLFSVSWRVDVIFITSSFVLCECNPVVFRAFPNNLVVLWLINFFSVNPCYIC